MNDAIKPLGFKIECPHCRYPNSIDKHGVCINCELPINKKYEQVKHPSHYNSHPSGIECIKIIQHFTANIAMAVKYLWRCGLKPDNNSIQELNKAKQYIDFEIERLQEIGLTEVDSKQKTD